MIEVLTSGMLNSVQDLGRAGYLNVGVSTGGAMDTLALRLGNALLGNEPGAAAMEVALFPFRLRFHCHVEFAVTGADCTAMLDGAAHGITPACEPPMITAPSASSSRGITRRGWANRGSSPDR